MNRSTAIAHAMEHQGAKGFTAMLSKANQIAGEPEYQWRCCYCGEVTGNEPTPWCCGEVHSEEVAECPECGDNIDWQTSVTGCGIEASVPKCCHCDWEGDPQ
jgi:hypothetical protein